MIRIALLGVSHMHQSALYKSLSAYPDEAEVIGYSDVPPADKRDMEKKERAALGKGFGVVKHYENYRDLLALKPDLALICSDTKAHADIACEVMDLGIPVVLEKPMAECYADAVRIAECAKKNQVFAAVNWPIAWFPPFNKAKELCDSGVIGEIMRVTYRSPATWGPFSYSPDRQLPPFEELDESWWYHHDRGGGSVLDYACYGVALSTWLFGKRAKSVWGITKNFAVPEHDIEDFSAMILDFGNGIGLLEGSWSTYNCGEVPSGPVIHGKEGTIVCERHSNLLKIYKGRSHKPVSPTEVIELPTALEGLDFGRNILDHMTKGTPLHPLLESGFNLSVMAALDAGRASAACGGIATAE